MNQASVLRKLTPEKRLQQALYLSDFVRDLEINGRRKGANRGRPRATRYSHHVR